MTGQLIALVILSTLVGPAVFAADLTEFRKVDVFITDEEGNEKKKDARLEIDTETHEIRLVDEKRGGARATYAVIPIDQVAALIYEVEQGNRWGGVVGVRPSTHWLTIESHALQLGRLRVRLNKDNQRELRFALRAATGIIDDLAMVTLGR
jgi:hypothetical protein